MKKIFYIVIAVCISVYTAAYAFNVIFDTRYIQTTTTNNNDITVRLFDTWTKDMFVYQHYRDDEADKWVKYWTVMDIPKYKD